MGKHKQGKLGQSSGKSGSKGKGKRKTLASQVDLLELYENSVMAPEDDCAFFDELYRKLRGRKPMHQGPGHSKRPRGEDCHVLQRDLREEAGPRQAH